MTNEQKEHIAHLICRYDEAQTTDAEERELAEWFVHADDVPQEWEYYKALFHTFHSHAAAHEPERKARRRRILWTAIGIAASVAVVGGAVALWSNDNEVSQHQNNTASAPWATVQVGTDSPSQPDDATVYISGPANQKEPSMPPVPTPTASPSKGQLTGLTHVDSSLSERIAGFSPDDDWEPDGQFFGNSNIRLGRNPASDAWRDSILIRIDDVEHPELLAHLGSNGQFDFDLIDSLLHQGKSVKSMSLCWWSTRRFKQEDFIQKWEENHGRRVGDIRYFADIETTPYTLVSQMSAQQLQERKQAYIQQRYMAGYNPDFFTLDPSIPLIDNTVREHIFAKRAKISIPDGNESIGLVHEDANGVYVPIMQTVLLRGDAQHVVPYFRTDSMLAEIRQMAAHADSGIEFADSDFIYIAFIYGGLVEQAAPHYAGRFESRTSPFRFTVDSHAPSALWGEAQIRIRDLMSGIYTVRRAGQAELQVTTIDKLYANDCPSILETRRQVEGTVTDTQGNPLSGAYVSMKRSDDETTTDAQGHFQMCLPYPNAAITIAMYGYQPETCTPTDSTMTIRLKKWGEQ